MPLKNLTLPLDKKLAQRISDEYGTPVYMYAEVGLRIGAKKLLGAFSWAPGYRNYFAVKATPTPAILQILHEEGMGFDCSSRAELTIMQRMGITGNDIFYTSNNTPREDFELAIELGATITIDDLTQVPEFIEALHGKHLDRVAVRYNPGDLKEGNFIIGKPTEAKFGMPMDDMKKAYALLKSQDIGEFGMHTMVASNELDPEYFGETVEILLDAVRVIEKDSGITIEFVNLGGGFGLNYHPEETEFDVNHAGQAIREVIEKFEHPLQVFTECGRYVTGPHGYLLSKVRYVMHKYKTFIGLDASMHDLMRPGMFDAYHHMTILGAGERAESETYDVVGSLCENNDKFAINRLLPRAKVGDFLVIHDVGAHGHTMGFNYNGMLRSLEVLATATGELKLIRTAETIDDYLRNVVW